MAAESILSTFLPVTLDKLISPAIQRLGVAFGTDEKLQKLKRILESIQSVLVDAEERQNADTAIKAWLSDLKDLAYKAEDVLDDFDFEAQRKQLSLKNMRKKVLFYCSFYKPIMTRFSLSWRLNNIIEKIEEIVDEIHKFNFQHNKVPQISYGRTQTHSYVDKENVFGREKDKEDIVNFLINYEAITNKNIVVLPIVAMGGMGKTTLSQLVYRDHRVEDKFSLRIWVCVSDVDFDLARLSRLIIEAATKKGCLDSNMELLQNQLRDIINGKRYLIVLDDVWNVAPIEWNSLKTLLDCGIEGSAVVVSTRSMATAKMMATHIIHDLKQLPEEDSWELFRRRAFAEGAEEPANLVKIGKDLIKRCCGLPLAINTLGSMMRLKNNEEDWKAVLDSEIWESDASKINILSVLRLSYNSLPSHLKQCFAFCAIYPKDYKMEMETLIQLWMANGYIPSDGNGDLEAKGRDIFDELVWRYFFQNVEEGKVYHFSRPWGYSHIVTCKMHDLMHDLAQSIMGKECLNFAHSLEWEDIPSTARHLLVPSFATLRRPRNQPVLSRIHTIIYQNENLLDVTNKYLSILKSLRVLISSHTYSGKIMSVRHLRHLRYLEFSDSNIMKLPEGICSLYNLQTLKLSHCWELKKLPDNLINLVNLRHLYIDGCHALVSMPRGMGSLKQLHTLTKYIVSTEAESGIEQLRDLNLGGLLELYGIAKVSNAIDAEDASLSSKQNLYHITLYWDGAGSLEVFEALKPHDGLRVLEVYGYGGEQFPKWMNVRQQLQNLVEIKLNGCKKCKELPPLGLLPFLEVLELDGLNEVRHIISKTTWCDRELHTTIFPSLKELNIWHMVNLEDWWEVEGSNAQLLSDGRPFLPCLIRLTIGFINNMTTFPTMPSLKYLNLHSCNQNFINIIFSSQSDQGLYVNDCGSLVHLSEPGSLTELQRLHLYHCDDLTSLPEGLNSLINLHIFFCNALTSLPEGLTKLSSLNLISCDGLAFLPQWMDGLIDVRISECNGLTSLPDGLIKLQKLDLYKCDGLVSLPEDMECLKYLIISECNSLRLLPEALLRQLPNLLKLKIIGNKEVIRPFQSGGEYWHLIENIPEKEIRQPEFFSSGEKCNLISRLVSTSKYCCLPQSS